MKPILSFLILILHLSTSAQVNLPPAIDSTKVKLSLSYEVKAGHLLEVHEDKSAFERREKISDNPFRHQAIYGRLSLHSSFQDKYFAELGLVGEERSFSGGNNTINNLIVFPKFTFRSIDTFDMGNKKLINKNLGGDFWDEDFNDILRIYNLDTQGIQFMFGLNDFWLRFLVIGDLSKNVGLDLHELYKVSLEYEKPDYTYSLSLSHNQLHTALSGGAHPDKVDFNLTSFFKYKTSDLELKSQIELRTNSRGLGLAAGVLAKLESSIGKLRFACRYYDFEFNYGYQSNRPNFRTVNSYVGNQLYSLKNYYRPMNQWLLMSERRTGAVGIEIGWSYESQLYKKLHFFVELDLNLIYRFSGSYNEWDNLPLYVSGLKLKFLDNYYLLTGFSNKHMNLDRNYQTFYAAKIPSPILGFQTSWPQG